MLKYDNKILKRIIFNNDIQQDHLQNSIIRAEGTDIENAKQK